MKRFLLIILLLLTIIAAEAQTIHILVFCDTKDRKVGLSATNTRDYFQNEFVPDLRRYSGCNVNAKFYYDATFTKSSLENAVNNLSSSSNDVIFFYYCGHGFNATSSTRQYPRLFLGGMDEAHSKWLEDVYSALKQKNHRLLVTIAEACNRVYDVQYSRNGPGAFGPHPTITKSAANYRSLFSKSGDYLCSSSKREQASWFDNGWGYFTDCFINVFGNETSEMTSSPSWDNIFATTTQKTQELADQNGEVQVPQWKKEGGTVIVKKPSLGKELLLSEHVRSKLDMVFRNASNSSQCDCIKYTGRNGYGAFKWKSGGYYFGHFEKGVPHGNGFSIGSDGVWFGSINDYKNNTMYFDKHTTQKFDNLGGRINATWRKSTFKFVETAKGNYFLGFVDLNGYYQNLGLFIWSDGRAWVGRFENGQRKEGEYIN